MTAIPLARYLTEFATGNDAVPVRPADAAADARAVQQQRAAAEAAAVESYAHGRNDGEEAARAIWEAKLRNQQAEFEGRLAAERQAWVNNEATRLSERLHHGLREVEARIAETTARILKPFLADAIRRRVVADLAAILEQTLSDGRSVRVQLSGPEDLLEALKKALDGKASSVVFQAAESCEVRATVDHTVFETRIAAWLARFEELVG
jgi:hypothetical protein